MKHGKVFPFLIALLLTLSACAGAPGNEPPEQLPDEDTVQEISETSEPVTIILDGQEIASVSADGWSRVQLDDATQCSWDAVLALKNLPADANISAALLMQNGTPLMEEAPLMLQWQDDSALLTHGGWDGLWQQLWRSGIHWQQVFVGYHVQLSTKESLYFTLKSPMPEALPETLLEVISQEDALRTLTVEGDFCGNGAETVTLTVTEPSHIPYLSAEGIPLLTLSWTDVNLYETATIDARDYDGDGRDELVIFANLPGQFSAQVLDWGESGWQQLPQPEYPDISAALVENSTVTLTTPEGFLQCITPADAPDIALFFDGTGLPYGEEAWVDCYLSPDYAIVETEGGFALSLTMELSLRAIEEDGQSYAPVFICSLPVLWQAGWENTLLICNP